MDEIYETPLVDLCWESDYIAEDGLESARFMETECASVDEGLDPHWAPASR